MTRLVRSELLKLGTTRLLWGAVATSLLVTALTLGTYVLNAGRAGTPSVGTAQGAVSVLAAGGRAALVMLVLGILSVTAEVRHSTLATTLLGTPSRRRVVVAKLVAVVAVSLVVVALTTALSAAVGVSIGALAAQVLRGPVVQTVAGQVLVVPLYAVLGVGIGTLVRNQTVAVTGALVWMLLGDTLLRAYGLRGLLPWTPGGATAAIALDSSVPGVLAPWAGALLLVAYGLGFAALGGWRLARRDIV